MSSIQSQGTGLDFGRPMPAVLAFTKALYRKKALKADPSMAVPGLKCAKGPAKGCAGSWRSSGLWRGP